MEENKRSPKRNRHTGGKVTAGAVILALLLAGGHFGLGIGREGGGLLTGQALETAQEKAAETVEQVQEKAQEAVETVQEVAAPQDDGVLTVTVKEDKLLYEGQEVTLAQLEENLLKDYKAETAVELKDDHAIKAAYDEVTALLQKLNIPFTTGK
jgi:hypothetical protein